MDAASGARLVLLGAIWGASFLFLRMAVPEFGAPALIEVRLLLAALLLAGVAAFSKRPLNWSANWRHYAIVGIMNTGAPFLLFAYAAGTLPASLLSVFNSLAGIFGAGIAAVWVKAPVTRSAALGLASGLLGVVVLAGDHFSAAAITEAPLDVALALGAATLAPFLYGLAGVYIKKSAATADSFSTAHGSLWTSALFAAPFLVLFPPAAAPGALSWSAALALGVICTGVAYMLYFRLIADLGAMRAMTVGFLIPVFGVVWGVVFLSEPITPALVGGGALIVLGTALATGAVKFPPLSAARRA
jgi:drug/metabolite transporter (DMT)-like permease